MKKRFEFLLGLVVLGVAGWFFFLVVLSTSTWWDKDTAYHHTAQFSSVTGLNVGADVRIGGVNVGEVTAITLDPILLEAIAHFTIRNEVRVPDDSSVQVVTDGLFGGKFLRVVPGGSEATFKNGDEFVEVENALALEELIGRAVLSLGGE